MPGELDPPADLPDGIEIEMLLGQIADKGYCFLGPSVLHCRDQSHVPFGEFLGALFGYGAQYGQAAIMLDAVAQDAFVARAGHPVEDDPPNFEVRIEGHAP